jgi:molybdopterin converting factor small subunit
MAAQAQRQLDRPGPPGVAERRVGLSLPASLGVPLRLPVAEQEQVAGGCGSGGAVWQHGGERTLSAVAIVRLFAAARTAAGRGRDDIAGGTVAEVLAAARDRYGSDFAEVLATCRIWVNGDAASDDTRVGDADEVAVLPPVSGGAAADEPTAETSSETAGGAPEDRAEPTLDELRARRDELQSLDDAVSYVRRVAQGRADLARVARRPTAGATGADPSAGTDIGAGLREVLAERLLGGGDRPPRPADDFSGHPLSAELDELCAAKGFGRLDELSGDELADLVAALDGFEASVSARRQEVFRELDAVTDEIVERYRVAHAGSVPADDEGGDE